MLSECLRHISTPLFLEGKCSSLMTITFEGVIVGLLWTLENLQKSWTFPLNLALVTQLNFFTKKSGVFQRQLTVSADDIEYFENSLEVFIYSFLGRMYQMINNCSKVKNFLQNRILKKLLLVKWQSLASIDLQNCEYHLFPNCQPPKCPHELVVLYKSSLCGHLFCRFNCWS